MHFLNKVAALSAVLVLMVGVCAPYSVFAQTSDGTSLSTQLPDKQHLLAYRNALSAVRLASQRQFPARMKEVETSAAVVKADMAKFVAQLKANNEVARFDASALKSAYKAGGPNLVAAITKAGGPVAMLSTTSAEIDATIQGLKREHAESIATWRNPLQMPVAHAIWPTVCGAFWFTISWGYAEGLAYHYCYK